MLCEAGRDDEGLLHLEAVVEGAAGAPEAFPTYAYHRAVRDGDASWYDRLAAYAGAPGERRRRAVAERLRAEGLHHPAPVAVVEGFVAGVAEALDHLHRDHARG